MMCVFINWTNNYLKKSYLVAFLYSIRLAGKCVWLCIDHADSSLDLVCESE